MALRGSDLGWYRFRIKGQKENKEYDLLEKKLQKSGQIRTRQTSYSEKYYKTTVAVPVDINVKYVTKNFYIRIIIYVQLFFNTCN